MTNRLRSIGPAALVTAAFIGPGTITTCTLAGAGYGYTLLWALLFSVIGIGNAAYETGNILGGALGLDALFGELWLWGPLIGIIAFVFLATMISMAPDLKEIMKGLFVPQVPLGAMLTVAGLVGTTVVPYNLFLHAALVQEKWKTKDQLKEARLDIWISIFLGGLVSISIVITSAAAFYGTGQEINNASDLAIQLEPVLGRWATGFIGIGLFAAGLTSAITAPLAAAYATCGILGWKKDLKSRSFRSIWMVILLIGIILSAVGLKPVPVILFAQAANGVLLPIIAFYLLWVVNDRKLMKEHHNHLLLNIIGGIVVLATLFLGLRSILSVSGII